MRGFLRISASALRQWFGSENPARRKPKRRQLLCEPLEQRTLLSVNTSSPPVSTASSVESIDGSGNNLKNPTWGAAGTDLLRSILPAFYGNGISTPNGQDAPSARLISDVLGDQEDEILDSRNISAFTYAWGQFIDHDLDLTPDGGTSDPIDVPTGDPQFDPTGTGTQTLAFTRSVTDPATGASTTNPLNQPTVVTSFIDGSMVYGSDAARAAQLRTFSGGLLKTSAGNLPSFNTSGAANANDGFFPDSSLFLSGDVRANENIELTALTTLFIREHNFQAGLLAKQHPGWTDEQLYQGARAIVIAEIQSITYNEYLPALLGKNALTQYQGYNSSVNPGISAEFSEAAFRFGHSQLDDDVQFLTPDGKNLSFTVTEPDGSSLAINSAADIASGETGIPLLYAFFNNTILEGQPSAGVKSSAVLSSVFKYLASSVAQSIDTQMVDGVRNVLFGEIGSGAGGQDLFALDIQRGRDMGLGTLNQARVAYGLPAYTSFSQITSDPTIQTELQQLYGTVDKVELFVGGLAEDHAAGDSVGPTFTAIIANQFERTRDGDRFFYLNQFKGSQLANIQSTSLADIINRNTIDTNLQDNVFVFKTSISGHVTQGSGKQTVGVAGAEVDLLDSTGAIIATATTSANGCYHFDQPGLGTFTIQTVDAAGNVVTKTVTITTGQSVTGIDFSQTAKKKPTPTPPPQNPSHPAPSNGGGHHR